MTVIHNRIRFFPAYVEYEGEMMHGLGSHSRFTDKLTMVIHRANVPDSVISLFKDRPDNWEWVYLTGCQAYQPTENELIAQKSLHNVLNHVCGDFTLNGSLELSRRGWLMLFKVLDDNITSKVETLDADWLGKGMGLYIDGVRAQLDPRISDTIYGIAQWDKVTKVKGVFEREQIEWR